MSCFCIDLPSDHGSGLLTGLIAVQSDWYRSNPRKVLAMDVIRAGPP
jgi:hypothetical protein